MSKSIQLETNNITRLLLKFSLNTFIALIMYNLYSVIDTLFVSWAVGPNAVGSISIAFPFITIQAGISTALGGGAASIISRKIGSDKLTDAGNIAFNTVISFLITATITTILGLIFLDEILMFFGVSEELFSSAKDYLTIILIGNIFSTGFSSIIRAEGNIKYGMLIWVIPISLNIVLDAIFIFGLGWGIKGSAWATIISQLISFCMGILYFLKYSILKYNEIRLKINIIIDILKIGFPSLVQQSSLALSLIYINNFLNSYGGTLAINIYGYINRIIVFILIMFTAITQAISPIAGYNYGRGRFENINKTINFSSLLSLCYSAVVLVILLIIPDKLLGLFTNESDIILEGAKALRIISLSLPFYPFALIVGATCQAIGRKYLSLILYASNYILFLLPAIYLLSLLMGMQGIWIAFPLSSLLSAFLAWLINVSVIKKEIGLINCTHPK